jgi:hypothetical protein
VTSNERVAIEAHFIFRLDKTMSIAERTYANSVWDAMSRDGFDYIADFGDSRDLSTEDFMRRWCELIERRLIERAPTLAGRFAIGVVRARGTPRERTVFFEPHAPSTE